MSLPDLSRPPFTVVRKWNRKCIFQIFHLMVIVIPLHFFAFNGEINSLCATKNWSTWCSVDVTDFQHCWNWLHIDAHGTANIGFEWCFNQNTETNHGNPGWQQKGWGVWNSLSKCQTMPTQCCQQFQAMPIEQWHSKSMLWCHNDVAKCAALSDSAPMFSFHLTTKF